MTAPLARGAVCPRCQSEMTAGTRYEADGTVNVTICWTCGAEEPPFGACCNRMPYMVVKVCRQCDAQFPVTEHHRNITFYCTDACKQAARRLRNQRVAA